MQKYLLAATLTVGLWPVTAAAVMVYDDADGQTSRPTFGDSGGGWDYVGKWSGASGVAISPHHFITARHVDGPEDNVDHKIGNDFLLGGDAYRTTGYANIEDSDLRVWTVEQTLPASAELFDGTAAGRGAYLFGYGPHRLGERVDVRDGDDFNGWQWQDRGEKSWGGNAIDGFYTDPDTDYRLIGFDFDAAGWESIYGGGDSGGGAFILNHDTGAYELAGIGYAISKYYQNTGDDTYTELDAAIFDARGLYRQVGPDTYALVTGDDPVEQMGYASDINYYRDEILDVIPEPASALLLGTGTLLLARRRR